MIDKLEELKNNGELVEVYTNSQETNKFKVGYVTTVSESRVILSLIDTKGYFDGYIMVHLNNIFQLKYGSKYINKINDLIKDNYKVNIEFKTKTDDFFLEFLEFIKKNNINAECQLFDSEFIDASGKIKTINEDELTLENEDEDGYSIIHLESLGFVYTNKF